MRLLPALPAALLLLSWLSPLHVLPWLSWGNEMLAVASLLCACAIALWVHRPPDIRLPSVVLAPLLLVVIAFAQWWLGKIPSSGSVWTVASYGFMAAASASLGNAAGRGPRPPGVLDKLAQLLLVACALQWIIGLAQVFGLWPGADWVARIAYKTRAGGNFAQPNQAALLFVMGLVGAAWLALRRKIRPGLAVAIAFLFALGIATTQSRSGVLAIAVLCACIVVRRRVLGGAFLVAAVAVLATTLLLFNAWPEFAAGYWMQAAEPVNTTTSGRSVMWSQFLQALWLHPWSGWGVMQVAAAQNAVADRFPEVMAATFSHNALLDLALWVGLPLASLLALMVGAWLVPRARAARTPEAMFCLGLVIPVLTQSMTEFPYAYAFFVIPVFFALGVLDALVDGRAYRPIRGWWAAGVLGVAAVLHVWAAGEYAALEEDFRVARFEALRIGTPPPRHEVRRILLLTQLEALVRATRMQPRPGMPEDELDLLRDAATLYPWGATYYRYGLALALNGRLDEARRQFAVYHATQGEESYRRMLASLGELAPRYPVLSTLELAR